MHSRQGVCPRQGRVWVYPAHPADAFGTRHSPLGHAFSGFPVASRSLRHLSSALLHSRSALHLGLDRAERPLQPFGIALTPNRDEMPAAPLTRRWHTFTHSAWEVYYENRGLLLIACCTFTGACMMCVVKLMTNLEDEGDDAERAIPISPLQVRRRDKYRTTGLEIDANNCFS